jgi:hypothetical protein
MIHVWERGHCYHSCMFLLYLKQVEPTLFYRLEKESARVWNTLYRYFDIGPYNRLPVLVGPRRAGEQLFRHLVECVAAFGKR